MNTPTTIGSREYILDAFESPERIAVLVLNRASRETVQRITSSTNAASSEFQAWLRHKNASGSDIYIGMNPLKHDAATRTKEDIACIRHVYIDLDYGGSKALEEISRSSLVPKANFIVTTSREKFQLVWKVDGMRLEEAEALLHALACEFGGDPAATDATRVLRLPGFANKKYGANFYVEARRYSVETYHLRDFKLHIEGQGSPLHHIQPRAKRDPGKPLSQSEHDWAYAKRALARGDDPEVVIQQIADYRSGQKGDPAYYARLTVSKALAALGKTPNESGPLETTPEDREERG